MPLNKGNWLPPDKESNTDDTATIPQTKLRNRSHDLKCAINSPVLDNNKPRLAVGLSLGSEIVLCFVGECDIMSAVFNVAHAAARLVNALPYRNVFLKTLFLEGSIVLLKSNRLLNRIVIAPLKGVGYLSCYAFGQASAPGAKMKMNLLLMFVVYLMNLLSGHVLCGVIQVPGDQPTIQDGIAAASNGDIVLVADGAYTGPGNRDIDYYGKAILVRSERGPRTTIIDCGGSATEPHRGFNFHTNEDYNSMVEGFTIQNGYIIGDWPGNGGGGINCDVNCSITITNCILTRNYAGWGGAIYCSSDGVISNCRMLNNKAFQGGGGFCSEGSPVLHNCLITKNSSPCGGGISSWTGYPQFYRCEISDNAATGLWGGGIDDEWCTNILLYDCTISRNVSSSYGGGLAVFPDLTATGTILNCVFDNNTAADDGGGIFWWEGDDTSNYNSAIFNSLFHENHTANHGGAIAFEDRCLTLVNNCTFVNNTAGGIGGAILSTFYAHPIITNSIFWGNDAASGTQLALWDYFLYPPPSGSLTIDYCSVMYGRIGIHVDPDCQLSYGPHNLETNPLFISGPSGAYYLSEVVAGQDTDSPCLNAGNDQAVNICLNVSESLVCLNDFTTRTDQNPDDEIVNLGFHYPITPILPTVTTIGIIILLMLITILIARSVRLLQD